MISRFVTITIAVVVLAFISFGGTLVFLEYGRLNQRVDQFQEKVSQRQRQLLRGEVERTITLLENQRQQAAAAARVTLESRVGMARRIFTNLAQEQKNLEQKDRIALFFSVLRPLQFPDRGYFFVTDFNGVSLFNPNRPELEGQSILGLTDSRGLNLAQRFIAIARDQGQGFQEYSFRKPGENPARDFPKLAFIAKLDPLPVYIGSGLYLDDIEEQLQKQIIENIGFYRFGENGSGYIFIIKVHDLNGGERFGTMFANANRPDLVGKIISDKVPDARGKLYRQEFLRGIRERGECFVEYWYKKFDQPEPEPKLSFFKFYPAASLIVAAGVYLPEHRHLVESYRRELLENLKYDLISVLVALLLISLLMVLIARWWGRQTGREFDFFRQAFSRAAMDKGKIPEEELNFLEMRVLAHDVNRMLAERNKLDRELQEREELFRNLTETSPTGIFIIQGDKFVYANHSTSTICGYKNEELMQMAFWQLVHLEMRELVKQRGLARQQGAVDLPGTYEFKIICQDKSEKWLLFAASAIVYRGRPAALGNIIDISDKVAAEMALAEEKAKGERELEMVRKMEAVGLLAGGIAHDFNNLLTAIYGNLSLAMMHLGRANPEIKRVMKNLSAAERSSARARDLTRQLLTFARGGAPVKELLDVTTILKETAEFSLSGSNVRLEFNFAADLFSLEVDRGQFCQVINNLVINADQAMPGGGVLKISAENNEDDEIGKSVVIKVQDEGVGIPAEHLDRIFEPYFSTKQHGSGLGLATIHSIVRRHGGRLTVVSEPGRGSCFEVIFPADGRAEERGEERMELLGGNERILVMDDEEVIREVCVDLLEDLGYKVDSVIDGSQMLGAYRQARDEGRPFALVIMDLTVPGGMGGKEAMAALLEIDPRARAIVCSGYSNDPVMADCRAYGFMGTCPKPFQFEVLSRVIREVLD